MTRNEIYEQQVNGKLIKHIINGKLITADFIQPCNTRDIKTGYFHGQYPELTLSEFYIHNITPYKVEVELRVQT